MFIVSVKFSVVPTVASVSELACLMCSASFCFDSASACFVRSSSPLSCLFRMYELCIHSLFLSIIRRMTISPSGGNVLAMATQCVFFMCAQHV